LVQNSVTYFMDGPLSTRLFNISVELFCLRSNSVNIFYLSTWSFSAQVYGTSQHKWYIHLYSIYENFWKLIYNFLTEPHPIDYLIVLYFSFYRIISYTRLNCCPQFCWVRHWPNIILKRE